MTETALALPRPIGVPNKLLSLSEEEMLRVAGGFALLGGVLVSGCLIAGGIIAVCVVGAAVGAAVYLATHD
jgi:hypothetical protein